MSNIGVGVVTCGIRELHPIKESVVFTDTDRRGSAYAKNELINKFYEEGKDYIFIFDDDCYPVIDGWQEKIIEWAKKNNVHYLGGIDVKDIEINGGYGDTILSERPYVGAYFFMDRQCIEKVGYFNERLIKYGWEDVSYSVRVKKVFGLTRGYPFPVWMNMYLHSMDMFGETSIPNMSDEEKQKYIEMNKEEFKDEANNKTYIGYQLPTS